jgi:hypothetical protein
MSTSWGGIGGEVKVEMPPVLPASEELIEAEEGHVTGVARKAERRAPLRHRTTSCASWSIREKPCCASGASRGMCP